MEFTKSLIKGKLVKRYKRFFADIKVNKKIVIAHCPNTGSMEGLLDINNEVWISMSDNRRPQVETGKKRIEHVLLSVEQLLAQSVNRELSFGGLGGFRHGGHPA